MSISIPYLSPTSNVYYAYFCCGACMFGNTILICAARSRLVQSAQTTAPPAVYVVRPSDRHVLQKAVKDGKFYLSQQFVSERRQLREDLSQGQVWLLFCALGSVNEEGHEAAYFQGLALARRADDRCIVLHSMHRMHISLYTCKT